MKKLVVVLLLSLFCTFLGSILIAMSSFGPLSTPCITVNSDFGAINTLDGDVPEWGQHRLAVIVPFRDRFEELLLFAPHLHKFLNSQRIRHKIYIINQVDQHRFNRGSLINVGHLLSRKECDYLVMHDVDLLPMNPELNYSYPKSGPFHIAAPQLHPKYHYSTFVGGILVLTREQFEKVNGLSNKYWGWGLEDDEFYARLKEAKLKISRPQNITTGQHNTFKHVHDRKVRKRDTARLYNQKEATRRRDRATGLNMVKYILAGWNKLTIDNAPVIVYNVKLVCDTVLTPWCDYKTPGSSLKSTT